MRLRKADQIAKGDWVLLPRTLGLMSFQEVLSLNRTADLVSVYTQDSQWTGRRYMQLWAIPAGWRPPPPIERAVRKSKIKETTS